MHTSLQSSMYEYFEVEFVLDSVFFCMIICFSVNQRKEGQRVLANTVSNLSCHYFCTLFRDLLVHDC